MTKSGKHCGKRRNCTFCAISSFVTMFSKGRLLHRRQKVSIWGKGLSETQDRVISSRWPPSPTLCIHYQILPKSFIIFRLPYRIANPIVCEFMRYKPDVKFSYMYFMPKSYDNRSILVLWTGSSQFSRLNPFQLDTDDFWRFWSRRPLRKHCGIRKDK